MELYQIRNLTFYYPNRREPALCAVNLNIKKGEWITLCGPTGSGKSTLLRHMKPMLAPYGKREGQLFFRGKAAGDLSKREQTEAVGFLSQDPDSQIVTDKVWHELAFGMESLGLDTRTIRRRVAEMVSFFGIQDWFYRDTDQLSGGQKQLLNLAGIMVMQPEVLLLDEPACQLDPIAAETLLSALEKINRELGTTVVMTEHRLEAVIPLSDRLIFMENGRIAADDMPVNTGRFLWEKGSEQWEAMPAPFRIYCRIMGREKHGDPFAQNALKPETPPLTIKEGRQWLEAVLTSETADRYSETISARTEKKKESKGELLLEASHLWFRYEKEGADILKDFSYQVRRGKIYAILGGNGAGKTTAISVLMGALRHTRGKRRLQNGKLAGMAQNPQTLFLKNTVKEDLLEMLKEEDSSQKEKLDRIVRLMEIEPLLSFHPYDLSGGEQQRVALAKVMLSGAELLFLDEPTKGMDCTHKRKTGQILREHTRAGGAVVMVSHDVEFCASFADWCGLLFDGTIVSEGPPRSFFSGNRFYTTAVGRMCAGILPGAILAEDVTDQWMK